MAGKVWKISICMMLTVLLCACTGNDMMEKKVRDLDFTVVSAEDISEELKSHIDERKEETFTLIYRDGENMYLIVGYAVRKAAVTALESMICIWESSQSVSVHLWKARDPAKTRRAKSERELYRIRTL